MLEQLDDYEWEQVFGFAGEPGACNRDAPKGLSGRYQVAMWHEVERRPYPVVGCDVPAAPFTRADVSEIIGMYEGGRDVTDWIIAGRLVDGRWFSIRAGCDFTGWDCQAWGIACVASTRDEILAFWLDDDARARLGIKAP